MNDDDQFEFFWDLYAHKVARKPALRAWERLSLGDRRNACAGLKDRVAHDREWLNGFQPHAATYLNGQRWGDKWERHIPRAQRPDNVRDTTNETTNLAQEQQGLARLKDMTPDNDPSPDLNQKSSEQIRADAMGKMNALLHRTRLNYQPQDEEALQARRNLLDDQAEEMREKYGEPE